MRLRSRLLDVVYRLRHFKVEVFSEVDHRIEISAGSFEKELPLWLFQLSLDVHCFKVDFCFFFVDYVGLVLRKGWSGKERGS